MARFLVTGGCGFIGSHLCAALRARGDAVRVLDDLSTGDARNLAPGAELHRGDVADPYTVAAAMAGVDGCFHLAAIASVERGTREWWPTHRVNLSASIAVFDAARTARSGAPIPVVYASSAATYGDTPDLPLHEGSATRPTSAYGADKLGCEQHARVAGLVHGVPTLGLRFFNVFGPRQDPLSPYSGVISIFCERLLRGDPITLHGDGGQTRDFVAVSDVIQALLAATAAASTTAPVLNVCTGVATSIGELARTIAALAGVEPEVRPAPARAGDIRHSRGDPTHLRATLGLGQPVALRDGLAATLDWLRAGRPWLSG